MNILQHPPTSAKFPTMHVPLVRSGARKELVDKSASTLPFPLKLYQLLEEAEDYCIDHIVSWLPSDEAFKIHDPDAFVESVMTKYFKQSKIKSFTRQLYIYGFSKISQGPNVGGFFHPQFRRGEQNRCMALTRRSNSEDRRVKSNRPKIIDCLKTSLAKAYAGVPRRNSSSVLDRTGKRPAPIPKMLFGELPTTAMAPTEILTDPLKNKKTSLYPARQALSLFDETFGDDFEFDWSINHSSLPSLGHISFLQSRALPGPPGGLRLKPPNQFYEPSCCDSLKASREIKTPEIVSSDALLLEPRAIEDMWQRMPDDDDLAPLNALVLLGSENRKARFF